MANEYKLPFTGEEIQEKLEKVDMLSEEIVDLKVIVTPQMYGAVGDGVTDDTQAFEDALAENSHVFVPSGNYLITRPIDLNYKKSLVSDDSQNATIIYAGADTESIIWIGRLSVFRNINITIQNLFKGAVFDTDNMKISNHTGSCALGGKVEHVNVIFKVESMDATLIKITVDSGTDANNIPRLTGVCFQTFHDIMVNSSSQSYGCGIKMTLIQGREFTEETKDGFPWITHIDYDDIYLGCPYTGIKATAINTSTGEHFERVNMGQILFNNVYTQNISYEKTRYFFDVDHISAYLTKCIGWDYHHIAWDYNEKANIIGENVNLSLNDCEMNFGVEFLDSCDFTAETDSKFTVQDNPSYFIDKYFKGTFLREGYDSVDAKIESKMAPEFIASITEEKINDVLYSGYSNVLDDPLTKVMVGRRWSHSGNGWVDSIDKQTTLIIPIVKGGNVIRWKPTTYLLGEYYAYMYFFNNDELTGAVLGESWTDLGFTQDGGYVAIENPSGYKYLALPLRYYTDISSETMMMTINREITDDDGKSYTEYLKENVIDPAIDDKFEKLEIPTDYAKASHTHNISDITNLQNTLNKKVENTETLTLVGVDENGTTHTWTIYGKVVS